MSEARRPNPPRHALVKTRVQLFTHTQRTQKREFTAEAQRGRPQPKLGISPAKTPRPLRSEKMVKRIRKNIYLSPPNLAPLRLGGRNFQIREFSAAENLRQSRSQAGLIFVL